MNIIVLDTETPALQGVEVSHVAWQEFTEDLEWVATADHMCNPGVPMTPGATAVNKITDEMVADKPPISEVLFPQGEVVLVCHNISFDKHRVEPYLNIVWDVCTYMAARRLYQEAPDHKLGTLVDYLGLEKGEAHQAAADVEMTVQLLRREIKDSGFSIVDFIRWMDEPFVFKTFPFGKHRGTAVKDMPYGYLKWVKSTRPDMDIEATLATRGL